jgi:hypothetical protein
MCPSQGILAPVGAKQVGASKSEAARHKTDIRILMLHRQIQNSVTHSYNLLHTTLLYNHNLQKFCTIGTTTDVCVNVTDVIAVVC